MNKVKQGYCGTIQTWPSTASSLLKSSRGSFSLRPTPPKLGSDNIMVVMIFICTLDTATNPAVVLSHEVNHCRPPCGTSNPQILSPITKLSHKPCWGHFYSLAISRDTAAERNAPKILLLMATNTRRLQVCLVYPAWPIYRIGKVQNRDPFES